MDWIEKVSSFIKAYSKKDLSKKDFAIFWSFLGFLLLLLFLAIGRVYWKGLESKKEKQSFDKLYPIIKTYEEKKLLFEEAKKGGKKPSQKGDKKKNLTPSGDLAQDYGDQVSALGTFIEQNPGRISRAEAALILSEIYSKYKMMDKAAGVLTQVLESWSDQGFLYHVMQMRLGDLWAMDLQCEKALSHWQAVGESQSFLSIQAQLKMGICLQEIGKPAEARLWFKKVEEKSPNSFEGFNAKRYLRFLKFKFQEKQQNKESFPTVKPGKEKNPTE